MAVVARVFPSRTKYTPDDDLAFVGMPDMFLPALDEVHVSCTFTWDKRRAEQLATEWRMVCDNVKLGGPAYDDPSGEFTPGMYIRKGYTMTSRGCPRKCDFCFVPRREGRLRELTIHPGAWVVDNNLLACSREHVIAVFDMLDDQKGITFIGGLDTYAMKDWHIDRLVQLGKRRSYLYIAYDQPSNKTSVERAIARMHAAGLSQNNIGCYVLVGYEGDTIAAADERCEWVFAQGGLPFAMFYRGPDDPGRKPRDWGRLTQKWTSLQVMFSHMKNVGLQYHKEFIRGRFAPKPRKTTQWLS